MLIALLSVLMTATGFFSRVIRFEGKHVFSIQTYNLCLKIQLCFNWMLSLISLIFSIIDLFAPQEFLFLIFIIFITQLVCNAIFTTVFTSIARLRRRKMVWNTLMDFLESSQDVELSDNAALVKRFGKEYPDVQKNEAIRALKRFKKQKLK